MMRPITICAGVALFLAPAVGLAHSFRAPLFVDANADGSFRYRAVFTASEPAILGGFGWSGQTNINGGFVADCFCESFCDIATGDSIVILVEGTLVDPAEPGQAESYVSLCSPGGGSAETYILPYTDLSVDDAPGHAMRLWNHPNPLSGQTTFHFTAPGSGRVALRIYDVRGRLLAVPLDEVRSAGAQSFTWNVGAASGARLAPGVYIARIEANGLAGTRRIVITK